MSLETSDYNEAVTKVLRLRSLPDLLDQGAWVWELDQYLDEMTARRRLSKSYASSRRYVLQSFAQWANVEAPGHVTAPMVQRWYDELKASKPTTAKHYVVHLRVFLGHLVDRRKLRQNPARGIRMDRTIAESRDVFVPTAAVAKLLDEAPTDELRLILLLGFECGFRKREIIEARSEWFDLKGGLITIPAAAGDWVRKNRKPAHIPMTRRVCDFFGRYGLAEPYILRPDIEQGLYRYRYDFRKSFGTYMAKQGLAHVTVHDMRRSFASNRISAGVSIERVASWLGDTIEVAWRNYARFLPASRKEIELGAA